MILAPPLSHYHLHQVSLLGQSLGDPLFLPEDRAKAASFAAASSPPASLPLHGASVPSWQSHRTCLSAAQEVGWSVHMPCGSLIMVASDACGFWSAFFWLESSAISY